MKALLSCKRVVFSHAPGFSGGLPKIDNNGDFILQQNCYFRAFRLPVCISVWERARLEIGEGVFFNDGVNVCSSMAIKIGSYTKIGDMTYIYDTDFHNVSPGASVKQSSVWIGRNVWIGANSMVLAGAKIGDHSVIAGGSIVTGEIPPKCLAAGSPAKVIKMLEIPDDNWIRS
jgi:maltose O-acetyltransferase